MPTEELAINFGGAACEDISIEIKVPAEGQEAGATTGTKSTVTCTLAHPPAAGPWHVEVRTGMGLVPIQSGLSQLEVPISTTGIRPSVRLNQNGGDLLTIQGRGFPTAVSDASVRFQDGSDCAVQTSSPTEITCVV